MSESGDGPDGPGGTSGNVRPLFSDRPTAAGLPVQLDVVETLEQLLVEAKAGNVTGVIIVAFSPLEQTKYGTAGKIPYHRAIAELEEVKFELQLSNHFRVERG